MISSTSNSQIKNIIQLQNKSKYRNKQGCFVVEGIRIFSEIPVEEIVKIYVSESYYNKAKDDILKKITSSEYEVVDNEVFKKISDTITPQGILAVVKQKKKSIEELIEYCDEKSLYLILEDVQDPGNLGTIVRTAEAAGVTGIIMSNSTVDIYNSKVVRSTMGSIFRVPFVYVENLENVIDELKKKNVTVYAAHLKGNSGYYTKDYKKSSAFLLGNEGNGLSDKIADKADEYIKIPMFGKIESLNVASAATILMYEALRQKL